MSYVESIHSSDLFFFDNHELWMSFFLDFFSIDFIVIILGNLRAKEAIVDNLTEELSEIRREMDLTQHELQSSDATLFSGKKNYIKHRSLFTLQFFCLICLEGEKTRRELEL
jgi:hypothetical protein